MRPRIHIFLAYKLLTNFLLVAFVQAVLPVDPKHPRIMRLIIDPIARTANDYAEFDTEESAEDWRRELTGMWYFCFILLVLQSQIRCSFQFPSSQTGSVHIVLLGVKRHHVQLSRGSHNRLAAQPESRFYTSRVSRHPAFFCRLPA